MFYISKYLLIVLIILKTSVGDAMIINDTQKEIVFNYNISTKIISSDKIGEIIKNHQLDDKQSEKIKVPKDKCQIWIFRHGESVSNSNTKENKKDEIRIAGQAYDSPLSDEGVNQAKRLGILLKSKVTNISAYYSSPLSRAVNTAVIIKSIMEDKNAKEEEIVKDKSFYETNYGSLEGATGHKYDPEEAKMIKKLPELKSFKARMNYRMDEELDNKMETNEEVYQRVVSEICEIAKQHLGESIGIASHNGPLKSIFMHLMARDLNVDILYNRFKVGNCAAICLESDGKEIKLKFIYNFSAAKS